MNLTNCPICGFPFPEPVDEAELRGSFDICPCCGCEYGYSDNAEYRQRWLEDGAQWFRPDACPENWNLSEQLANMISDWKSGLRNSI
jgi:hypothetical protein